MAVTHSRGRIVLTEKDASDFSHKMEHPDSSIMKKRDAFIKESKRTLCTIRYSDGKVILKSK